MLPAKITFTDYRRFMVSFGLALMVAAFSVPWLLISGTKVVIGTIVDFKGLQQSTVDLLYKQRDFLLTVTSFLPLIFWLLFLTGIGCSLVGFYLWIKKQRVIDRREEIELRRQELELAKVEFASAKDETGQAKNITNEIRRVEGALVGEKPYYSQNLKEPEMMNKFVPKLQELFPKAITRREVMLERKDGRRAYADLWLKLEEIDLVGEMKGRYVNVIAEQSYQKLNEYVRTIKANYERQGSNRKVLGFMIFPSERALEKDFYEGYPIVTFDPHTGQIWNPEKLVKFVTEMQQNIRDHSKR